MSVEVDATSKIVISTPWVLSRAGRTSRDSGLAEWAVFDRTEKKGGSLSFRLGERQVVPGIVLWKSKFTARSLNHRVVLHAITATPARWRAGSTSPEPARHAPDTLVDFHIGIEQVVAQMKPGEEVLPAALAYGDKGVCTDDGGPHQARDEPEVLHPAEPGRGGGGVGVRVFPNSLDGVTRANIYAPLLAGRE